MACLARALWRCNNLAISSSRLLAVRYSASCFISLYYRNEKAAEDARFPVPQPPPWALTWSTHSMKASNTGMEMLAYGPELAYSAPTLISLGAVWLDTV